MCAVVIYAFDDWVLFETNKSSVFGFILQVMRPYLGQMFVGRYAHAVHCSHFLQSYPSMTKCQVCKCTQGDPR